MSVPSSESKTPLFVHEVRVEDVEVVLLEPLQVENGGDPGHVGQEEGIGKGAGGWVDGMGAGEGGGQ